MAEQPFLAALGRPLLGFLVVCGVIIAACTVLGIGFAVVARLRRASQTPHVRPTEPTQEGPRS
jgi:hypothetical protein